MVASKLSMLFPKRREPKITNNTMVACSAQEAKKYVQQIEQWNRELESKVSERTKELEEKNFTLKATSKELETHTTKWTKN